MEKLFQFKEFIRYAWRAKGPHGVHSPFVFQILNSVLLDRSRFYAFDAIEKERKYALKDDTLLTIKDFGAGFHGKDLTQVKVRDIAGSASLPPHFAQILFKWVNLQRPTNMLELGTSLGFTAAYLASTDHHRRLWTLEGCPDIAAFAGNIFRKLALENVHLVQGAFEETLPSVLKSMGHVDFAYIDGNHRLEPTLKYFEMILERAHPGSVLVFDDIRWSREMSNAWESIIADQRVTLSLDLYRMGVVFFHEGRERQHFVLRNGWRPWRG